MNEFEWNIQRINDLSNDTVNFVIDIDGGVELTEWQIEWLKALWDRKPNLAYLPVRNHGRQRQVPFKWEPIVDEWSKNWEENPPKLELTPEKLAEIRTDVLEALKRQEYWKDWEF